MSPLTTFKTKVSEVHPVKYWSIEIWLVKNEILYNTVTHISFRWNQCNPVISFIGVRPLLIVDNEYIVSDGKSFEILSRIVSVWPYERSFYRGKRLNPQISQWQFSCEVLHKDCQYCLVQCKGVDWQITFISSRNWTWSTAGGAVFAVPHRRFADRQKTSDGEHPLIRLLLRSERTFKQRTFTTANSNSFYSFWVLIYAI